MERKLWGNRRGFWGVLPSSSVQTQVPRYSSRREGKDGSATSFKAQLGTCCPINIIPELRYSSMGGGQKSTL